jgi:hypothetical protein
MTRLVAALLLGGLIALPTLGASPDPKDLVIPPEEISRARELIKRLGSEVYREREEAHAELAKMGRLARPALLEAAASDADPEIRYRTSRLLPKAGADELKARLDTFLEDKDGKYEHDLPGLKLFRKHVGTDEKARGLFVDIVKSPYNVELLQALDKTTTDAGRAISDRRTLMYSQLQQRFVPGRPVQAPQQIPLQDIACLLFAESITPAKDIPRTGIWSYVTGVTFLQQPQSMTALNNNTGTHADIYKKIVGQWMETRDDVNDLNQLSYIAGQTLRNFPQSLPLLRKIVNTEGVYGYAKGQALMHLTQIKGKEEIPFITKLLTDGTQVQIVWFGQNGNQPVQHQCLLKDVALAYLISLSGQKMTDYGYKFPPGSQIPQPNQIGYGNYAFENDEARNAAMVKYGFWLLKYGPNGPAKKDDADAKKDEKPKPDLPPVPPRPEKR